MTKPTPWRHLLAMARSLGLTPPQFWRLSLLEWRALTAPLTAESMPRTAFDALSRRFPDSKP